MKLRYYQLGGKPTTLDSLQLLENSNLVRKYYKDKNYIVSEEGISTYNNDDSPALHEINFDDLKLFLRHPVAQTKKGMVSIPINDYYRNIDKNKYLQRESLNVILDLDAPMTLYDRRINPTTREHLINTNKRTMLNGDMATLSMYPRLQITPINQLTKLERIKRQQLYGVKPGETNYLEKPKLEQSQPKKTITRTTKFVPTPKPDTTKKPIVTNNLQQFKRNQDSLRLYRNNIPTNVKEILPVSNSQQFLQKQGTHKLTDGTTVPAVKIINYNKSDIKPISVYKDTDFDRGLLYYDANTKEYNNYTRVLKPIFKKPTNMVYDPGLSTMTPKGLPTFITPQPQARRMPDRIEKDSRTGAEYKGLKISHYTDGLGRYTAKLNLTTRPGIQNRISYKEGGIVKAQSGTTLSGPTISAKKYPTGTIITQDPNDPRLKAYRDSLKLYNSNDDLLRITEDREEAERILFNELKARRNANYKNNNDPNLLVTRQPKADIFNKTNREMERYHEAENSKLTNKFIDGLENLPTNSNIERSIKIPYKTNNYINNPKARPYKTLNRSGLIETHFVGETDYVGKKNSYFLGYKKPVIPVIFSDRESPMQKMTPKGLPTSEPQAPEFLKQPDRIEFDSTKHAAYKGIKVSHYTDGLGRYTAKLNLVTKPGVEGRLGSRRLGGKLINYKK